MTIARAPIVDRMHLAHRCDELAKAAQVGVLDPETVLIIRGDDELWYIQDMTHRPLCRAVCCLGCGRNLERELKLLTHLNLTHPGQTLRLPTLKGLP
ncbi:MAG TPA: hypothetical protein VD862_04635 [Candidatus Paceibacterota bacterium]|nr:hypothetical protein [Candidatus Paceibacterota bacterium]